MDKMNKMKLNKEKLKEKEKGMHKNRGVRLSRFTLRR